MEHLPFELSPFEIIATGMFFLVFFGFSTVIKIMLNGKPVVDRDRTDLIWISLWPPVAISSMVSLLAIFTELIFCTTKNTLCYETGFLALGMAFGLFLLGLFYCFAQLGLFFSRQHAIGLEIPARLREGLLEISHAISEHSQKILTERLKGDIVDVSYGGACFTSTASFQKGTWVYSTCQVNQVEVPCPPGCIIRSVKRVPQNDFITVLKFNQLPAQALINLIDKEPLLQDEWSTDERRKNPRHLAHWKIHFSSRR